MTDTLTLSVPDMSCGHCRASITQALNALGASGEFDMEARTVRVGGKARAHDVLEALDDIGFPATQVAD